LRCGSPGCGPSVAFRQGDGAARPQWPCRGPYHRALSEPGGGMPCHAGGAMRSPSRLFQWKTRMDVRVISIGTLAAHPLWKETSPVRTGHATSTLIRTRDKVILVDPGLPEPAIAARLSERTGLRVGDVTHVFLTSFQPDTRRGIMAFADA